MKKIIGIAVFISLIVPMLAAADTPGSLDYEFWVRMDQTTKLAFVTGYAAAAFATRTLAEQSGDEFVEDWSWYMFDLPGTIGQIHDGVELFYMNPRNHNVPISAAILIVAHTARGTDGFPVWRNQ